MTYNWNQQLSEWFSKSGKTITQINQETGIPKSTLGDYIHGKSKHLDRISPDRLKILHNLTGLTCFEYTSPKIEMSEPEKLTKGDMGGISEIAKRGKDAIDRIVEKTTSELSGIQKLEEGLLKAQQYEPTTQQRADAIMELLDVLSEEIDYFRTAPEEEVKVLSQRLQEEPESFGYVSQILNILYSGKKLDSWMLLSQPPSKIKKITKK